MPDKVILRIERSDGPGHPSRWEEFQVDRRPNANVISVLMQIQRNPVTADGKVTTPPAWDAACLEEVCGSCTMVINGKVRQACSALIDKLAEPITLQPMKKFPLVRDLTVDRGKMFDALRRVRAWIPIDGTYDLGPGPSQAPEEQELRYVLSTCMTCGCCLEGCPQVSPMNCVAGETWGQTSRQQPQVMQVERTYRSSCSSGACRGLMEAGGVNDCGKA